MRPVNKGTAPKSYANYKDAKDDLADKIGRYCSYCEMKVWNSIEVEHVIPRNNGGDPTSWSNFLLSCRYCNGIKNDRNISRTGYFWPDTDNTLRAFTYREGQSISADSNLSQNDKDLALSTIDLMGLDREPGALHEPSDADTRWRSRYETWQLANASYTDWQTCQTAEMKFQIVRTAIGTGHFSIWMEVFKNHTNIREELIKQFIGTDTTSFKDGVAILRPGGAI